MGQAYLPSHGQPRRIPQNFRPPLRVLFHRVELFLCEGAGLPQDLHGNPHLAYVMEPGEEGDAILFLFRPSPLRRQQITISPHALEVPRRLVVIDPRDDQQALRQIVVGLTNLLVGLLAVEKARQGRGDGGQKLQHLGVIGAGYVKGHLHHSQGFSRVDQGDFHLGHDAGVQEKVLFFILNGVHPLGLPQAEGPPRHGALQGHQAFQRDPVLITRAGDVTESSPFQARHRHPKGPRGLLDDFRHVADPLAETIRSDGGPGDVQHPGPGGLPLLQHAVIVHEGFVHGIGLFPVGRKLLLLACQHPQHARQVSQGDPHVGNLAGLRLVPHLPHDLVQGKGRALQVRPGGEALSHLPGGLQKAPKRPADPL